MPTPILAGRLLCCGFFRIGHHLTEKAAIVVAFACEARLPLTSPATTTI